MKIVVIIPTYNEKENIEKLSLEVLKQDGRIEVLVVDDNSPDKTYEIVEEMIKINPKIHIIKRSGKLGLGTAYVAGFKWAIEKGYDKVITMDADFSHHPRYIPDLINAAEEADISIGSRYVKNGGTVNWGVHRQMLSKGANLFAKTLLSLKSKDNTAGFRCYSVKVLKQIDLSRIKSNGYSFLIEMIYFCHRLKFKVKETPIIFVDRREGVSKISKNEIFKALFTVLRLFVGRLF